MCDLLVSSGDDGLRGRCGGLRGVRARLILARHVGAGFVGGAVAKEARISLLACSQGAVDTRALPLVHVGTWLTKKAIDGVVISNDIAPEEF